ncbi:MAG: poly-gamma-glutamate synthase PgsB [Moorea sp. SIOASIH]|uniref:poly-gamma-glutamate synthase PgsB n=1 Tax=Moorena sp. SIOASIH TaxID=2607817 RepID=UPI0013BC22D3|nr:poly-gamma-glutamate synthase PgsB [Moorena sp. SIOASIH]NEO41254.1 poly-gamma-glutamate synthase PgsB [Moorena sp. SIOASIH]
MFKEALPFLLTLASLVVYILYLLVSYWQFRQKRDQILYRVHVNGIRGKSTVTRYVAAVVRAAGYQTFGKITGSTTHILHPNGKESVWPRKGYANVNEQVAVMRYFFRQQVEAVVMECMAINPVYGEWLEKKVMRSHVSIITNVRYDHPEYLGETLEEIAHSLAVTIPENGIVITAESNPILLDILNREAKQRGAKLIAANASEVMAEDLKGFSAVTIEDNVAIALEVGKLLGVPRKRAVQAMWQTLNDESALKLESFNWRDTGIVWANLFAVNDRESFNLLCDRIFKQYPDHAKVVLLNNRSDRLPRVALFANLAKSLSFDRVVTIGSCEAEVQKLFASEPERLVLLGDSTPFKDAPGTTLLTQITEIITEQKILLVGAVNIHTPQAQELLSLFQTLVQAAKLEAVLKPKQKKNKQKRIQQKRLKQKRLKQKRFKQKRTKQKVCSKPSIRQKSLV